MTFTILAAFLKLLGKIILRQYFRAKFCPGLIHCI